MDQLDTVVAPRPGTADAPAEPLEGLVAEPLEGTLEGPVEGLVEGPDLDGATMADAAPEPVEPAESLAGRDRALARLAWLVPSLLMLGSGLVRITWPGLWADELATWGMATTPWGRMWPVLHHVDAAIAPYYAFSHALADVFGASDLTLRLPSALAMTAAVGIVAAIGTRLAGPRTGLLAGLVLAVLPTTSRYAQEARPYALVLFAAALATLLLIRALDRPSRARYAFYTAAVALVGLAHFVALSILAAHAITAWVMRRRTPVAWLISAVAGALPSVPVVYLALHQSGQISWIPPATFSQLTSMPGDLFGLDILGGIVVVLALLGASLKRPVFALTVWAVLPTVLVFAASQVTSLWLPRYLLFTLPAWALLAALTLARAPLVRGVVLVLAIAVIGLPLQVQDRMSAGHSQATSALAAVLATNEQPGDGIVYAQADPGGAWTGRDLVAHYVPADAQPRDVFLVRPPRTDGHLLAGECTDLPTCLAGAPRLWTIRNGTPPDPIAGLGFDKERLLRDQYVVSQVWTFPGLTLALLVTKPNAIGAVAH